MEFVEKVMHIIHFSHFLQGEVVKVFFFFNLNAYTDCLVAEFPVLEHPCSISLYPVNFKKTTLVGSEKLINLGCECLVKMQS